MPETPPAPREHPAAAATTPRPRTILFDDLAADLVWPQLLRAGPLALRPSRVGLGSACVLITLLIFTLGERLARALGMPALSGWLQTESANAGAAATVIASPPDLARELHILYFAHPYTLLVEMPVLGPVILLVIVAIAAIFAGAICRSAVCDYAFNQAISWPQALGFALSRWAALVSSMLIPLLIVWGIALAIALAGLAFRVPGLNALAGALWILALLGGLLASVIVIVYTVGSTLLPPAVACEGCDAADALQRVYAFVLARPLRLALYALILLVQGAVVIAIVALLARLTITLSTHFAMAFAGSDTRAAIFAENPAQTLSALERLTRGGIRLWNLVPLLLVAGFVFSYLWTAATLLYLAVRRAADGMDMREVWTDAHVPGTMALTPAAADLAAAPRTASPASPAGPAPSGVSDTGPADET